MAANVETMFSTREKPWHGLGTIVMEAPDSHAALELAGLNWNVVQKDIVTVDGNSVEGFKANVRDVDDQVLGIVTDRYKVVQNREAFAFTDALLGEGVRYETAGSLQGGRRTWMLAKLPYHYIISGDEITPYMVFMNCHDGSGSIKVAMTPIRVVCQNTLNMALATAKRSWSCNHTGDIEGKMEEARDTLLYASQYMTELGRSIDKMNQVKLSDSKVYEYLDALFPMGESATVQQARNIRKMKEDAKQRYFDAPDLQYVGKNGYRFINAISDFATHAKPLRERSNYRESLFAKTVDGNPLIDKAYQMVMAAA
jgi:phage/plasmid-like protein (TIGR03299 family)